MAVEISLISGTFISTSTTPDAMETQVRSALMSNVSPVAKLF